MADRSPLTPREKQDIERLKDAGVLVAIDENQLRLEQSNPRRILVACRDGHRIWDLMSFQCAIYGSECNHPVLEHGGSVILGGELPEHLRCKKWRGASFPRDQVLLADIAESMAVKETLIIDNYAHFPCVFCRMCEFSVLQCMARHALAKDRIRTELVPQEMQSQSGKVLVTCHVHVDWFGHKKGDPFKTYFFNRKEFSRWLKENPHEPTPETQLLRAA